MSPFSLVLLLAILCLPHHTLPQQIFIDKIPTYSSLSACAVNPVSSIVRDMASGCGDDSRTTSYACFCYTSSAAFARIISTAVVENCTQATPTPQAQASRAVAVFSSYCQLGSQLGYPSASATSTNVSDVPFQGGGGGGGGGGLSTTAQICIGVIVPLFCAGVSVMLFLLKRQAKRRKEKKEKEEKGVEAVGVEEEERWKEDAAAANQRPSLPTQWTSEDTTTGSQQARGAPVHESPAQELATGSGV